MLRNIFAGLGVAFALMCAFCASFLGRVAYDMHAGRAAYERLAVDITRELSLSWTAQAIKDRYAGPVSYRVSARGAQRALDQMKPLGALRYVDGITCRTLWTRETLRELASPAEAAAMLAALLSKTVRISFVAKFDHGFADVTLELKSEDGAMKLWHLQIDSQEPLPEFPHVTQAISRA